MSTAPVTLDFPPALIEVIAERAAELIAERQAGPVEDGWMTVDEAAAHLRCPKSRIYSLVSARRIPFEKDGSRTLFLRSELDVWLRNGGGRRP